MKVLHVIWDLTQGGAQIYIRDLVGALLAFDRISVDILILSDRGPLSEDIEMLGVPVKYAKIRHGADIYGFIRLFHYLQNARYDIIHSHASSILFNYMLSASTSCKLFTEHGGGLMGGRWKYKLFYKLFHRNYYRFVAISESMKHGMITANSQVAGKVRLIYNGIDLRAVSAIERHKGDGLPKEIIQARHRVGIVARLVPQKGVSTFLNTAAVLTKTQRDMVFIVVGDGPLKQELLDRAEELSIKDKVFFLGYRQDAKRILKLFDVFLFTSEWEPFGLVIAEAMTLSVPVVALNKKGAAGEIIRDGVDGLLIDEKEPTRLAESVLKILDNQKLREEMITSAYERVSERFTIEQNARRVINVYEECLPG